MSLRAEMPASTGFISIGICQNYGPTEMQLVNKYELHGERADVVRGRFIVQIDDNRIRKQIV